jgi:hypothetical protein
MTTLTCTRHRFDDQVCFSTEHDQPWPDLHKVRMSPLEAGPLPIKNSLSARPDDRRDALPGDKRQPASAREV